MPNNNRPFKVGDRVYYKDGCSKIPGTVKDVAPSDGIKVNWDNGVSYLYYPEMLELIPEKAFTFTISDIYKRPESEVMKEIEAAGYEFVDFRPPQKGETVLGLLFVPYETYYVSSDATPRVILQQKAKPFTLEPTEENIEKLAQASFKLLDETSRYTWAQLQPFTRTTFRNEAARTLKAIKELLSENPSPTAK